MVKFLGKTKNERGGKKEYKTVTEGKYSVNVTKVVPYAGKKFRNMLGLWLKINGGAKGEFNGQIIFFYDYVKYEKAYKNYEEGTGDEPSFQINEGSLLERFYDVCKDILGHYPESGKELKGISIGVEVKHTPNKNGEGVFVNAVDFFKVPQNKEGDSSSNEKPQTPSPEKKEETKAPEQKAPETKKNVTTDDNW